MTQPLKKLSPTQRQAVYWLSCKKDPGFNEQQAEELHNWLEASAENQQAYLQVSDFWEQIAPLPTIATKPFHEARFHIRRTQLSKKSPRLILTLVVLLSATILIQPEPWKKLIASHYITLKGQQEKIVLADGSQIQLNTDTEIRIDRFNDRTIWFDRGEAWFNVVHNSDSPFLIKSGVSLIRDVGTQFTISKNEKTLSVSVLEGEVAVSQAETPEIHLTEGQKSTLTVGGNWQNPNGFDREQTTGWLQGNLVFKQNPLKDVLSELSRYHNVQFEIADRNLENLSVTGQFPFDKLKDNLKTLSFALNVKTLFTSENSIIVRPNR